MKKQLCRTKLWKKGRFAAFFCLFFLLCGFFTVPARAEGLTLRVEHDTPHCGTPMTFTLYTEGGSGNYKYMINGVYRYEENSWQWVTDPSRSGGYVSSNVFSFTFYASGTYRIYFHTMDLGSSPMQTKREILQFTIEDPAYPSAEAVADSVAAQCLSLCSSDFDKALWLHDWLLNHCTYDYSYLYCGAEGALCRGTGTCEAYHHAYTMLLGRCGVAYGRVEGGGHVWTGVRMNGAWYNVDVTWDDNGFSSGTYENYLYFGLPDSVIRLGSATHEIRSGMNCTSFEDNYFIRTGKIASWSEPFVSVLQNAVKERKESFTFPDNSSLPAAYKSVLYNLAAHDLSKRDWSDEKDRVTLALTYSHTSGIFTAEISYEAKVTETTKKETEKETTKKETTKKETEKETTKKETTKKETEKETTKKETTKKETEKESAKKETANKESESPAGSSQNTGEDPSEQDKSVQAEETGKSAGDGASGKDEAAKDSDPVETETEEESGREVTEVNSGENSSKKKEENSGSAGRKLKDRLKEWKSSDLFKKTETEGESAEKETVREETTGERSENTEASEGEEKTDNTGTSEAGPGMKRLFLLLPLLPAAVLVLILRKRKNQEEM